MKKAARLAYQFYKWLIFAPFLGLTTVVASLCGIGLNALVSQRLASRWCGKVWGRLNCFAIPVFTRVTGREHLNLNRSHIIVANHQSLVDILVIHGWLGIDLKWVMKKELRKIPFMGLCCEKLGHIIIDRSNTEAALASINAAKDQISDGACVIFFPEGTRSRNGQLGPFKKGAFRLALDLGLPILPVSIRGTREILRPDTMDLMPGLAEIIFHPPIETAGTDIDKLPVLMDQARNAIQSSL